MISTDAPGLQGHPADDGRSHALLGAAGWLAAAPLAGDAIHKPFDLPTLAAGTLVCAGAALLPDLDHHDGLIANSLGPPTRLLAARGRGPADTPGAPLLWPWRERLAIPVLDHTNDWTETFVVVPLLGVLIFGLAWVHFAAVRTAALTWLDGLAR